MRSRRSRRTRRYSGYMDGYSNPFSDGFFSRHFWIPMLIGVIVVWVANQFGAWYGTPIVGFLAGTFYARTSHALTAGLLMGVLSWGGALFWQNLHYPIASAASMISGVMGFGTTHGYIVIILTLMVGVLLSFSSAWLGSALRALFTSRSLA